MSSNKNLLEEYLKECAINGFGNNSIPKAPERKTYPLSRTQQGIFALCKFDPDSTFFNTYHIREIVGELDIACLKMAVKDVQKRHEALRTNICEINGEPRQLIYPDPGIELEIFDLRKGNEKENKIKEKKIINKFINSPFKLKTESLIRFALIIKGNGVYTFIPVLHHLISDALSIMILYDELSIFYFSNLDKDPPALPGQFVQMKDYVEWETQEENENKITSQEKYWLGRLKGDLPVLNLPTEKEREFNKIYKSRTESIFINKEIYEELEKYCREHDVTLFMYLFAILNVFFHRVSGQEDIIIGTAASLRSLPELNNSLGLYSNALAVRSKIDGEKIFLEFLENTKNNLINAYDNKDYPFEKLVNILKPKRDLGRSPIYDVYFEVFQDYSLPFERKGCLTTKRRKKHSNH